MVQGPNSYAGLDLDARQGGMSFTTCKNLVYQPATRRPPRLGRPILARPPILTTVTTFRRSSKGEDSSLLFKTERVSLKNRPAGRTHGSRLQRGESPHAGQIEKKRQWFGKKRTNH
ncbi:hypothetical protein IGI04_005778 [Brassica rapa subsp. trilocularis]|uniref:Uncharacterized protein n=1 Tax=Brassica rapa subsp. trilocularis TaxID=1813537 RepID=A0ABQ7NF03_BRACM|nr:hypothetical protein IGI04_005778 [Brassica rapa subsp. trilocularis]